ncbi:hypothetical protein ASD14_12860 [Lysobacter sp. Root494]|nr:hypothetical protein ASD14_12860 [Lysobacter sp. Root494]
MDLRVRERRYGFLRVEDAVLETSSFLDTRIDTAVSDAVAISADEVGEVELSNQLSWLFHTSFCGSTLLARVLHVPPYSVCLREPLVLRRLGDSRHEGESIEALAPQVVGLLSRAWHRKGAVVVKPTHAALNIASDLLRLSPRSRAVILISDLDDFLVSNLKKTLESQAKIPQLVERAMRASGFHARLPAPAFDPPDLLCAAVLQWAAQRELIADIVDAAHSSRVRVIGMQVLLEDLLATAENTAAWLSLDVPAKELASRCANEGRRNAKATHASYSVSQRLEEVRLVERSFSEELRRARIWADKHVLPFMRALARDAGDQVA